MFTDNYIKFQKARFTADSYNSYASLKRADGTSVSAYATFWPMGDIGYWMTRAKCNAVNATWSGAIIKDINQGVYFGTGSTPATKADYKLESPITSGLTITNPSALVWDDDGNGKYSACADFVVRNTSGAEINIYEIGVFTPTCANRNGSMTTTDTLDLVLMERTVLAEPITIAPGEAKLVTYKITFNQTLNVE